MVFTFLLQTLKSRHLEKRDNTNILWENFLPPSISENLQFTSKLSRLANSLSVEVGIKAWVNMDIRNSSQVNKPHGLQRKLRGSHTTLPPKWPNNVEVTTFNRIWQLKCRNKPWIFWGKSSFSSTALNNNSLLHWVFVQSKLHELNSIVSQRAGKWSTNLTANKILTFSHICPKSKEHFEGAGLHASQNYINII